MFDDVYISDRNDTKVLPGSFSDFSDGGLGTRLIYTGHIDAIYVVIS